MIRGFFVTGTDTGVGKTVVSAALMVRLGRSRSMCYWKPIQTGIEQDDDTAQVKRLASLDEWQVMRDGVRLEHPLSPHLSARLSGCTIAIEPLMKLAREQTEESRWIVEGAGGVLVPLNDETLMIDFIHALALPAVVVARSGLGTINHTLLTLSELRRRAITVAAVVMVGEPHIENRRAIEQYGEVKVLGEIPLLHPLTPETLCAAARSLDPDRHLERMLS
ncbi:MAG: dethiobiotin synthase [Acidobacteriaceae bacterium]|jgi:dethiobiotin synthase|nr:dethiobiotin synthase [Acidobacteriaceae bacterium]